MTTNHPVPTPPPAEPAPSLRPGALRWTLADFRRHVPRIIAERDAAEARLRVAEETLAAVRDRLERSDWIVARELLRLVDASARCRHCGALPDSDGDHSCSCPNPDSTCAEHPVTEGASR